MQDSEVVQLVAMAGLCGIVIGYGASYIRTRLKTAYVERSARQMLEDTKRECQTLQREAKLHAKDELIKMRERFDEETKERRKELLRQEERLTQREQGLDRKFALMDRKEDALEEKLRVLETEREGLVCRAAELDHLFQEERDRIQSVAGMSQEEARQALLQKVEEDVRGEAGAMIRRLHEEATATAEQEARRIISLAVERYAADQVSDITTSSVTLPNDEMKGRIIGKEGRNIRSLEAATGINFMIDDTPEVVVISGFDPLRREIARIALERLISDGRINPARIEEVVTKVQSEIDETTRKAGEDAIFELSLRSVAPEIVRTLGRLKFRHSYSQNVLQHSIEVGHLMGTMAGELGLDIPLARRIGLFHDIGKALDHQIEGGHALIGADLLRRNGEIQIVCNAVAAHHHEVEGESVYAPLVAAADAMTASRPGARSETTELYVQRLEKLEEIANAFRGVVKSFAIQAGREVRVIVEPSKIDDNEAMQMARNISKQVEQELKYPGQIKVTVVRETRCIEYAR
jgi:ribonucrease Y